MVSTPSTSSQTKGVVRQVIGPVLDVEFPAGKLPKILNALRIEAKNPAGQEIALTLQRSNSFLGTTESGQWR